MKLTSVSIPFLLAPLALAVPTYYERGTVISPSALTTRTEASAQDGGLLNGIYSILHAFDLVFDGGLRLIPGLDCLVPDPQYDGLPGSKGNNHGKPDCKSLKKLKDKTEEAKDGNAGEEVGK